MPQQFARNEREITGQNNRPFSPRVRKCCVDGAKWPSIPVQIENERQGLFEVKYICKLPVVCGHERDPGRGKGFANRVSGSFGERCFAKIKQSLVRAESRRPASDQDECVN